MSRFDNTAHCIDMQKVIFVIGALLFVAADSVLADDLAGRVYSIEGQHLEFTQEETVIRYFFAEGHRRDEVEASYEIRYEQGFLYISVDDWIEDALVLYNDDLLFIDPTHGITGFDGLRGRNRSANVYAPMRNLSIEATSFLTETLSSGETVSYRPENLRAPIGQPWVEGVPDDGIGEAILVTFDDRFVNDTYISDFTIWIVNGFVSVDRPHLYEMNNRVAAFRVIGLDTGAEMVVALEDTPHPQPIDVTYEEFGNRIRLEIAEVYEGTRFDDTCIAQLFVTGGEVSRLAIRERLMARGVWE